MQKFIFLTWFLVPHSHTYTLSSCRNYMCIDLIYYIKTDTFSIENSLTSIRHRHQSVCHQPTTIFRFNARALISSTSSCGCRILRSSVRRHKLYSRECIWFWTLFQRKVYPKLWFAIVSRVNGYGGNLKEFDSLV